MITIDPINGMILAAIGGFVIALFKEIRRDRALKNRLPAFTEWWRTTGSGIAPIPGEYAEAHAKRVAAQAWDAGFAQRDAA
jgi:predicted small secreted protein